MRKSLAYLQMLLGYGWAAIGLKGAFSAMGSDPTTMVFAFLLFMFFFIVPGFMLGNSGLSIIKPEEKETKK